jgi:hypothetical protein
VPGPAAETPIVALWRADQLPIADGLFFADGRSYAVDVVDGRLVVVEELDLAEVLAEDQEWVTAIDITGETELPDGYLCVGEGAHGSEGFFARLDAGRELVWVCYLSQANPFKDMAVENRTATVTSTSGVRVTADLDTP